MSTFEMHLKTFVEREGLNPIVILNLNEEGKIDLIKNSNSSMKGIGLQELKTIFEMFVEMFDEQLKLDL